MIENEPPMTLSELHSPQESSNDCSETQTEPISSEDDSLMSRSERRKMEKREQSDTDKLKEENHRLKVKLQQTTQMLTACLHRSGGTIAIHEGELQSVLMMPMKLVFIRSQPYLICSFEPDDRQEPLIEQARMVPTNLQIAKR